MLALSWERIEALLAAKRKERASELLILVQAARCDSDSWDELQKELIRKIKS